MDEDRWALLDELLLLQKQFGLWWGTERGKLFTGGLLNYPLWQLIPLWMQELARIGITGGKDGALVDVTAESGTGLANAGSGQMVWIKLGAYRDDDGHLRAEVRERPARTDLAILGALAALEGDEPDAPRLRADYERLWMGRERERSDGFSPVPTENERALLLAKMLLEHRDSLILDQLPEQERRERVVGIAKRIGTVKKALRELAAELETGTVRPVVQDAQRDVLAAELHDLKGWSWAQIGRYLHIPQTPTDKTKNDNQRARRPCERGRKLLKQISK